MGACGSKLQDGGGDFAMGELGSKIVNGSPWVQYKPVNIAGESQKPISKDTSVPIFDAKDRDSGNVAEIRQVFVHRRFRTSRGATAVETILRRVLALSHPNILRVNQAYVSDNSVHLVTDAPDKQAVPLAQFLASAGSLSVGLLTSLSHQMATIVNYLHQSGFVHGFLAPESFVVIPQVPTTAANNGADSGGGGGGEGREAQYATTVDAQPRVMLVDFGLESAIGRNVDMLVGVSRAAFASPEVARKLTTLALYNAEVSSPTPPGDVFSLGSILYFMFTGSRPFAGDSTQSVLNAIHTARVGEELFHEGTAGQHVPKGVAALIITMMEHNESHRIRAKDVVASKYLQPQEENSDDNGATPSIDSNLLKNFAMYQNSTVSTVCHRFFAFTFL